MKIIVPFKYPSIYLPKQVLFLDYDYCQCSDCLREELVLLELVLS